MNTEPVKVIYVEDDGRILPWSQLSEAKGYKWHACLMVYNLEDLKAAYHRATQAGMGIIVPDVNAKLLIETTVVPNVGQLWLCKNTYHKFLGGLVMNIWSQVGLDSPLDITLLTESMGEAGITLDHVNCAIAFGREHGLWAASERHLFFIASG